MYIQYCIAVSKSCVLLRLAGVESVGLKGEKCKIGTKRAVRARYCEQMTWVGRDQYLFSKAGEFEIGQEGIARYTQFDRGGARGVLSAECQNSVPCPTTAGSAIQQPTPASRRSTSCAR